MILKNKSYINTRIRGVDYNTSYSISRDGCVELWINIPDSYNDGRLSASSEFIAIATKVFSGLIRDRLVFTRYYRFLDGSRIKESVQEFWL